MNRLNWITSLILFAALVVSLGTPVGAQEVMSGATRVVETSGYRYTLPANMPFRSLGLTTVSPANYGGADLTVVVGGDTIGMKTDDCGETVFFDDVPQPVMPIFQWVTPFKGEIFGLNGLSSNETSVYALSSLNFRSLSRNDGVVYRELPIFSDYWGGKSEVRSNRLGDVFVVMSFYNFVQVGSITIASINPTGLSGILLRIKPDGRVTFLHLSAENTNLTFDVLGLSYGPVVGGTISPGIVFLFKADLSRMHIPWFQFLWSPSKVGISRLAANAEGIVAAGDYQHELHAFFGAHGDSVFVSSGSYMARFHTDGAIDWVNRVVGEVEIKGGSINRQGESLFVGRVGNSYAIYTQNVGMGGGGLPPVPVRYRQFSLTCDSSGRYISHRVAGYGCWNAAIRMENGDEYVGGYREYASGAKDFSLAGYSSTLGDFVFEQIYPNDQEVVALSRSGNFFISAAFSFTTAIKINDGLVFSSGLGQPGFLVVGLNTAGVVPPPPPPLGVEDANISDGAQEGFGLRQNYPNPFNPVTKIAFDLPIGKTGDVSIYNLAGQLVFTFPQLCGAGVIEWRGINNAGLSVSSGAYIYRLRVGDVVVAERRMLFVK